MELEKEHIRKFLRLVVERPVPVRQLILDTLKNEGMTMDQKIQIITEILRENHSTLLTG